MALDVEVVAAAAATTLANAVVTDGWRQIRARVGRLLGRGNRERELAVLADLDEAAAAGAQRTRYLHRLLLASVVADPALATELAALAARYDHIGTRPVTQRGRATSGGLVIQAGRDITINRPR